MIDGLIFAGIVIVWDIFRSWIVAPRKTEKRIKKHIGRLEEILIRLERRMDKLEKTKNGKIISD